jgi:hypothetical protein
VWVAHADASHGPFAAVNLKRLLNDGAALYSSKQAHTCRQLHLGEYEKTTDLNADSSPAPAQLHASRQVLF